MQGIFIHPMWFKPAEDICLSFGSQLLFKGCVVLIAVRLKDVFKYLPELGLVMAN